MADAAKVSIVKKWLSREFHIIKALPGGRAKLCKETVEGYF